MLERISQWLAPTGAFVRMRPERVVHHLSFITWFFLIAITTYWLILALVQPDSIYVIQLSIWIIPVLLSVWLLARRRRTISASYLLVIGLWAALLPVAAISQSIISPAYLGLIVVTLCAGFFLGIRIAIACAIVNIFAGLALLYAQPTDVFPVYIFWNEQIFLLTHALTMLSCLAILHVATNSISASLRDAEQQLQERNETEAALRSREEQLQSLTSAIPDLVITFSKNAIYQQVHSIDVNLPLLPSHELIGRSVYDILPFKLACEVEQTIQAAIATRTPQELEYELTYLTGQTRCFHARAATYQNGAEQSVIWLARDVTERKNSEQQLREHDLMYRRAISAANAVPYYRDYSTESYTFMGEGILQLTGYKATEITPQVLQTLEQDTYMRGSAAKLSISEAIVAARTGNLREWSCDMLIHTRSGELRWINDSSIEILGSDTTSIGSLGILQDITERKHSEEELRHAQKLQAAGQLASGFAHDFNNLLTIIINYTSMLVDEIERDEPPTTLKKDLEQIQHASERAAALTRQLLAFSRRQVLDLKIIQLNDVVARITPMLERLLGIIITLHIEPAPHLDLVRVDVAQAELVIINLAVNARDAMPSGGMLFIKTSNLQIEDLQRMYPVALQPGTYTVLSVRDTGIGMDAETQARVFEPFFTTKAQGRGTGLGLATVYGIVKQFGGQIWFESSLGQGTTFTICLPSVAGPMTAQSDAPVVQTIQPGHETILLVDDDLDVRTVTCSILERQGYTVLETLNDSAAAICQNYTGAIDLLLTDVMMPGINGVTLAEQLQAIRPAMRVLLISGYTGAIGIEIQTLAEKYPFLAKPFTPQLLSEKIRSVLDAQPLKAKASGSGTSSSSAVYPGS